MGWHHVPPQSIITASEHIREHKAVIGKKSKINAGEHDKMSGAINAFAKGRGMLGLQARKDLSDKGAVDDKDQPACSSGNTIEVDGIGKDEAEGDEGEKEESGEGDGNGDEEPEEQPEKTPQRNPLDVVAKQLTDKMGSVIRCVELLKGRSLAKAIRDKLAQHQDRIPSVAKDLLRLGTAKKQDAKEIRNKVREAEKMLSEIKELLAVARPHIQKKVEA